MVTSAVDDSANPGRNFGDMNRKLNAAGFNETMNIEATSGSITIHRGESVSARKVKLTADAGAIDLDGTVDVSGSDHGGTAELYAQNLTVGASGTILAKGTGTNARGGDVTLGVSTGMLYFSGGTIDVSGSGTGTGGTVTFRDPPPPPPNPSPINMSLTGTIKGASSVVAEVDKVYVDQFPVISSTVIDQISTDISTYMNTYATSLKSELLAGLNDGQGNPLNPTQFHFRPGVVIQQTTGDITLGDNWDLSSWRFTGEPGTVTIRAAGNLNINAGLIDNPTNSYRSLRSDNVKPSWSINLVAGAQTYSPDFLAIKTASMQGNLTLLPQAVVYTERGLHSVCLGEEHGHK